MVSHHKCPLLRRPLTLCHFSVTLHPVFLWAHQTFRFPGSGLPLAGLCEGAAQMYVQKEETCLIPEPERSRGPEKTRIPLLIPSVLLLVPWYPNPAEIKRESLDASSGGLVIWPLSDGQGRGQEDEQGEECRKMEQREWGVSACHTIQYCAPNASKNPTFAEAIPAVKSESLASGHHASSRTFCSAHSVGWRRTLVWKPTVGPPAWSSLTPQDLLRSQGFLRTGCSLLPFLLLHGKQEN